MKEKLAVAFICLLALSVITKAQVAINTSGSAPNASSILDISSTSKGLLIPRMTDTEMYFIVSPATGLLVYNTSAQAIYQYSGTAWTMLKASNPAKLQDADANTSVDAEFAPNNDKIYFRVGGNTKMILNNNRLEFMDPFANLFIGENAGFATTSGTFNLAIGYNALRVNATGTHNTAVGYAALYLNTGSNNTAYGSSSLNDNNTGYQNTAVGSSALANNLTGYNNVATGYVSMLYNSYGNENTATGVAALYNNQTGHNNSAFGREALRDNANSDNTAVGYRAALVNYTGFQNVAVGSNSLVNNTTGSYHTAIGYNTGPSTTNLANTTTLGIDARATATDMVRIGNTYVSSIGGQVGWTTFSDGRFKENVREDVPGLSFINQLRPVSYHVNRTSFNDYVGLSGSTLASDAAYSSRPLSERTTGFIAQEVEASAQSLGFDFSGVDAPDNPDDYYGLRYAEFVVPLVKAVQELSAQNAAQQKMIEELEKKVEALENENR